MKAFLLSASALALTACAATSADEPHQARTDHRVHVMRAGDMHHGGHARVVEVVGDHGDRTVHVVSGDGNSVISVNGRRIEVVDGAVIVDGERHDFNGGRIVIGGDEIHVSEGFGPHMAWSWSEDDGHVRVEIARAMEEVERAMAEIDSIDWVAHDEALAEAFAEIEDIEIDIEDPDEDTWIHRDGERVRFGDLSPAEQAEIREELAEARIAARDALRSARIEMRSARRDGDMARVEARIARDAARDAAHRARDEARAARNHHMRWQSLDVGDASEIRIEDENGNTRVWLDERELEGAELEEFLDRMEERNERFAQMQFGGEPRVMVFTGEDGETEVVRSRRVIVEIDNDGDRRVIEIEPGDEPDLEGDD